MELDPSGSARRLLGMVYRLVIFTLCFDHYEDRHVNLTYNQKDTQTWSFAVFQHPKLGVNTFEPYTGEDPIFECLDGRNRRHHGITSKVIPAPAAFGAWSVPRTGWWNGLCWIHLYRLGTNWKGRKNFRFLHFCISAFLISSHMGRLSLEGTLQASQNWFLEEMGRSWSIHRQASVLPKCWSSTHGYHAPLA